MERLEALLKKSDHASRDGKVPTRVGENKLQPADTHPSRAPADQDFLKISERGRADVTATKSSISGGSLAAEVEDANKTPIGS